MSAVLIVDDSPMDRALFRTILNRAGYDVHEVSLGREVPSKVREFRPHVIILDVNLPDTDGHTVCRALRADPVCVGVPILMLTVRDNESDILAGLEAGADDYVAKDAAAEIFLARVRRLVRYRQMATTSVLNEQLAQVGRLLTGIVHEIRGPLSVIRGNAELLRMALGEDHPSRQWTDPILRSCQLLQARLEHLMAAVRSGPPILQELEVPPLVREAADLFRKGIDLRAGNIKIDLDLAEGLPPVRADAGRLMQVLLNLLSNAYEAVEVEVRDDGPGIPEVHLGRIFEPFFTTKEGGSGYGLYLASEILREHGGLLTACNDEQGGACFTIRLPLAEASSLA